MARSINFDFRRGGGSTVEVMYGEVTLEPTIMHSVGTSAVIPAPTKFDLIAGKATATNVAPSPDPVDGKVAWAYKVSVKDRHGKKFEWLVGVPDALPAINFISLPRYFETKPPLFGQGPQGVPGSAATVAVGSVTSGATPAVTNSGTSTDAVLNFQLQQGPEGPMGAGVNYLTLSPTAEALPTTYPNGLSYFFISSNSGTGWPAGFLSVWTDKANSSARTSQRLISHSTGEVWERIGTTTSVWGGFFRLASDALASPLNNGLMPALDKAKLDGMTPAANSKTFAALASTYQAGFSTLQVRAADGWPIATTAQVVTFKTVTGAANTTQWVYPVEGTPPQFRVADAAGVWGTEQSMATQAYVQQNYAPKGKLALDASDFGVSSGATGSTNTAGFNAAFAAAGAAGIPLVVPKASYTMGGFVSIPSNTAVDFNGSTLDFGASGASSYVLVRGSEGSPVNVTGSSQKGDTSLTVASSGLVAGDWLKITSLDIFDSYSTNTNLGELCEVSTVSGSTVNLVSPLIDSYTTSVRVTRMEPATNFKIENLVLKGNYTTGTNKVGLSVSRCVGGSFTNLKTMGIDQVHISVRDSYDVHFDRVSMSWALHQFMAYGISFANASRNCSVRNASSDTIRHGFSQNNDSSRGGITRDITCENFYVNTTSSAIGSVDGGDGIDTHTASENIIIRNCIVNSSRGGGINVESRSAIIEGNIVSNCLKFGISARNLSDRDGEFVIANNIVTDVGTYAMMARASQSGATSRTSLTITGNTLKRSVSTAMIIGYALATCYTRDVTITGNVIRNAPTGMTITQADSVVCSGNSIVAFENVGIDVAKTSYASITDNAIRSWTTVAGQVGINLSAVTRSRVQPGAIRAEGTGSVGIQIASDCATTSVGNVFQVYATTKVRNDAGAAVEVGS